MPFEASGFTWRCSCDGHVHGSSRNVKIDGVVSGPSNNQHREFAKAFGEMTRGVLLRSCRVARCPQDEPDGRGDRVRLRGLAPRR